MTCRQNVWKRTRLNQKIPLVIDARMGAEFARIYTVHPTNIDEIGFYEQNLYGSQQAERLPCSARSIIYCAAVIAGIVALLIKKHAVNNPLPREVLVDLPHFLLMI